MNRVKGVESVAESRLLNDTLMVFYDLTLSTSRARDR